MKTPERRCDRFWMRSEAPTLAARGAVGRKHTRCAVRGYAPARLFFLSPGGGLRPDDNIGTARARCEAAGLLEALGGALRLGRP